MLQSPLPPPAPAPVRLVLDIDETLCPEKVFYIASPEDAASIDEYEAFLIQFDPQWKKFLHRKIKVDMISEEGEPECWLHHLLPGVLELIRDFFMHFPNGELVFFFMGPPERNKPFFEQLVNMLTITDTPFVPDNVHVFSMPDCLNLRGRTPEERASYQPDVDRNPGIFNPQLWDSSIKKSLRHVLQGDLRNTIFIDDRMGVVCSEDVPNFLRVPGCKELLDSIKRSSFKACNQIFYAAGLLSCAYEAFLQNNIPLTTTLARHQMQLGIYGYSKGKYDLRYFEIGLKALQKIDRKLTYLNHPPNYEVRDSLPRKEMLPALALAQAKVPPADEGKKKEEIDSPRKKKGFWI